MDDTDQKPMRQTDLAIMHMFEMILDILVRQNVPPSELEAQFARNIELLKGNPHAIRLTEGLREIMRLRVAALRSPPGIIVQ